jgi:guanylate kinase
MTAGSVGPRVIILSSPSGGGKNTIAKALLAARDDVAYSVSATTRAPRRGERDGIDYHFVKRAEFENRRDNGDLLEWAEYSGYLYGTLRSEIDRVLGNGQHALLDIEVEGARQLRKRRSDVVSIFIVPPSAAALVERLAGRKSDSAEQVVGRIRRAIDEFDEVGHYDHVVVNDDLDVCVAEVSAIMDGDATVLPALDNLEERITDIRRGLRAYLDDDRSL